MILGCGIGVGIGAGAHHTIIATGVGTRGIGAFLIHHIRMVGGVPVGITHGTIHTIIPVSIHIRDIIRGRGIMEAEITDGLMARPADGVRQEHAPAEADDIVT